MSDFDNTVTDEEARYERFCPMRAGADQGISVANSCLGPACMAWRWAGDYPDPIFILSPDREAEAEPSRPATVPSSWIWYPSDPGDPDGAACWMEPEDETEARRRGYCGLARLHQGGCHV